MVSGKLFIENKTPEKEHRIASKMVFIIVFFKNSKNQIFLNAYGHINQTFQLFSKHTMRYTIQICTFIK